MTAAAFTAGVASVPTPLTEVDWDGWMYHTFFQITSPEAVAAAAVSHAVPNNIPAALRREVDSKAMRKAEEEDAFFCAIEVQEIGTAVMQWHFNSRMLFMLS